MIERILGEFFAEAAAPTRDCSELNIVSRVGNGIGDLPLAGECAGGIINATEARRRRRRRVALSSCDIR